jgi:glutamate-1-semialdehyde 2,1-aminomutase/spore coat polysaccharide biosynthesis protein SpsF
VAPVFLERGKGCHVWDVDGNLYLDWSMALCALTLGYCDEDVNSAIVRQLQDGTIFTLPHRLETEVSERLVELIPCAEMVRFGKNGSDATSGAVRLARAVTKRDVIACCGYHGWQDWFVGTTTRNSGVPAAVSNLTVAFAYNDLDGLHRVFREHPDEVAAVIMEPVGVAAPEPGYLEELRELCHRNGALLIFDEIVTGFRMSMGGAQEYFGVEPDLACFGKGMGNGFPIASIVGPERLMREFDEVFFSLTFGGETLSLAACIATIDKMERSQVIPFMWQQGQKLKDGFEYLLGAMDMGRFVEIVGYAPRSVVTFHEASGQTSLLYKSLFQQECIKRGVLFTTAHDLAFSHDDETVDETLRVYRAALEVLKDAIDRDTVETVLEGPPSVPVFRRP